MPVVDEKQKHAGRRAARSLGARALSCAHELLCSLSWASARPVLHQPAGKRAARSLRPVCERRGLWVWHGVRPFVWQGPRRVARDRNPKWDARRVGVGGETHRSTATKFLRTTFVKTTFHSHQVFTNIVFINIVPQPPSFYELCFHELWFLFSSPYTLFTNRRVYYRHDRTEVINSRHEEDLQHM